jgi:hypothetical protein
MALPAASLSAAAFKRQPTELATLIACWPHGGRFEESTMDYAIGIALALIVSCFARVSGFDRDRAFYPTMMVVIALYYVLFAAMGGSSGALVAESIGMSVFVLAAVLGFKLDLWLVVAALAGHGVFDALHARVVANPGVPEWWAGFCLSFDVGAATFLAWLLQRSKSAAHPRAAREASRASTTACATRRPDNVDWFAQATSVPPSSEATTIRHIQPFGQYRRSSTGSPTSFPPGTPDITLNEYRSSTARPSITTRNVAESGPT